MNTRSRFGLVTALLLLFVASALAADASRIQVSWAPNDKLSEVRENSFQRGNMKPAQWQQTLGDFLRQRAQRLLAADQRLDVTIDDIKLAGAFEPWRGPQLQDVRFMRDIYPPRIDLHYRLTGADGKTIREGAAKLRDLSYLQRPLPNESDPLRYDKRLIAEWLTKEFGRPKN